MKLTYSVSLEDFRSLYPPYAVKPGKNAGYVGAMIACGLIAALGVFCMEQGMGAPMGGFLIGLGAVAAVSVHLLDGRSVQTKKKKYEENLASGFRKVHCKERRLFETDEKGFTSSCQCATVTRPWSELTGLTDGKNHVVLSVKGAMLILPKSAFPSGGEITELIALASSKLKQGQSGIERYIEFNLTREDLLQAQYLHITKGGGWRRLLKRGVNLLLFYGGVAVIWNALKDGSAAILAGIAGASILVTATQIVGLRKKHYFGSLRVYFTEEGLQLQDPNSQSRQPWRQFIGYLEDPSLILLYYNPLLYRIIPKRAIGQRNRDFIGLVKAKVLPFDYRNPEKHESVPVASREETVHSSIVGS
jgi:hypothetical protein